MTSNHDSFNSYLEPYSNMDDPLFTPDSLFDQTEEDFTTEELPSRVMNEADVVYQKRYLRYAPHVMSPAQREQLVDAVLKANASNLTLLNSKSGELKPKKKRSLRESVQKGEEATQELVVGHLRVVAWLARGSMDLDKKYRLRQKNKADDEEAVQPKFSPTRLHHLSGNPLPFGDRMQAGSEALIYSIQHLKNSESFMTYMVECVRRGIQLSCNQVDLPFYIPPYVTSDMRAAHRFINDHLLEGTTPKHTDAINLFGSTLRAERAFGLLDRAQHISLETLQDDMRQRMYEDRTNANKTYDDGPSELADILPDPGTSITVAEEAELNVLGENLNKATEAVGPRVTPMIELFFGLEDGVGMTYEDVGKLFDLSGGRIRQLLMHAFAKIRTNRKLRRTLEGYVELPEDDPTFGIRTEIILSGAEGIKFGLRDETAFRLGQIIVTEISQAEQDSTTFTLSEYRALQQDHDTE